jgi:hypothetical protein
VSPAVVEDRYYIMKVVPRGFINLYISVVHLTWSGEVTRIVHVVVLDKVRTSSGLK